MRARLIFTRENLSVWSYRFRGFSRRFRSFGHSLMCVMSNCRSFNEANVSTQFKPKYLGRREEAKKIEKRWKKPKKIWSSTPSSENQNKSSRKEEKESARKRFRLLLFCRINFSLVFLARFFAKPSFKIEFLSL